MEVFHLIDNGKTKEIAGERPSVKTVEYYRSRSRKLDLKRSSDAICHRVGAVWRAGLKFFDRFCVPS